MARRELLALIVLGFVGPGLALGACSEFDEAGAPAPAADAAPDGSNPSTGDAGADAARDGGGADATCRIDASFATTTLVDVVSSPNDEGIARLSSDERSIYFDRYLGAGPVVHMATRPDRSSPFGVPVVVTAVDSVFVDNHPNISEDGLSLHFTRFNTGGHYDVLVVRRASLDAQFGAAAPVLETAANETYGVARGDRLWFSKERTASLNGIFEAALDGGDVRAHAELSGDAGGDDYDAVVSADGLAVYFSSRRAGGPTPVSGELENIYVATRGAVSQPWSAPRLVEEVNTGYRELVGWLSPDNCRLYFASNRVGSLDIYVAER